MAVLIFANGEESDVEWIRPYLGQASAVIAADGGTRYLYRLGHIPDVVIGDMDSLSLEQSRWLANGRTNMVHYPAEKDETDLELALQYATRHFDEEILVFAGLGGRIDQTLANIWLLAHPDWHGRTVKLVTKGQHLWLVTDKTAIHGQAGDTVSLLPLDGDVYITQATGLKWPLHNEMLLFGLSRGISNVMTAPQAEIVVGNGRLLVVHMTIDD
ncbi:MAG: thiamine diphosphokinase [Candidatus Promineifilaceae bacterium]